ncbi:MAG: hypothetical protein ACYCQI_09785 [Gammaproteobacteria bacterium]
MPITEDNEILNAITIPHALKGALVDVFNQSAYQHLEIKRIGSSNPKIPPFPISDIKALDKSQKVKIEQWLVQLKEAGFLHGDIDLDTTKGTIAGKIVDEAILRVHGKAKEKKATFEDIAHTTTPRQDLLEIFQNVLFNKAHLSKWDEETGIFKKPLPTRITMNQDGTEIRPTSKQPSYRIHGHLDRIIKIFQEKPRKPPAEQLKKIIEIIQDAAIKYTEITNIPDEKSIPTYFQEQGLTDPDKHNHMQIYAAFYRALKPIIPIIKEGASPDNLLLSAAINQLQTDLSEISVVGNTPSYTAGGHKPSIAATVSGLHTAPGATPDAPIPTPAPTSAVASPVAPSSSAVASPVLSSPSPTPVPAAPVSPPAAAVTVVAAAPAVEEKKSNPDDVFDALVELIPKDEYSTPRKRERLRALIKDNIATINKISASITDEKKKAEDQAKVLAPFFVTQQSVNRDRVGLTQSMIDKGLDKSIANSIAPAIAELNAFAYTSPPKKAPVAFSPEKKKQNQKSLGQQPLLHHQYSKHLPAEFPLVVQLEQLLCQYLLKKFSMPY